MKLISDVNRGSTKGPSSDSLVVRSHPEDKMTTLTHVGVLLEAAAEALPANKRSRRSHVISTWLTVALGLGALTLPALAAAVDITAQMSGFPDAAVEGSTITGQVDCQNWDSTTAVTNLNCTVPNATVSNCTLNASPVTLPLTSLDPGDMVSCSVQATVPTNGLRFSLTAQATATNGTFVSIDPDISPETVNITILATPGVCNGNGNVVQAGLKSIPGAALQDHTPLASSGTNLILNGDFTADYADGDVNGLVRTVDNFNPASPFSFRAIPSWTASGGGNQTYAMWSPRLSPIFRG